MYDTYADWETGHTTAYLTQDGYTVRTVGPTTDPVTTIGRRPHPARSARSANCAPRTARCSSSPARTCGTRGDDLAPFAAKAREFLDAGVPVAAICGATAGLAREGLLDDRAHTSAGSFYLAATGYKGGERYARRGRRHRRRT